MPPSENSEILGAQRSVLEPSEAAQVSSLYTCRTLLVHQNNICNFVVLSMHVSAATTTCRFMGYMTSTCYTGDRYMGLS